MEYLSDGAHLVVDCDASSVEDDSNDGLDGCCADSTSSTRCTFDYCCYDEWAVLR